MRHKVDANKPSPPMTKTQTYFVSYKTNSVTFRGLSAKFLSASIIKPIFRWLEHYAFRVPVLVHVALTIPLILFRPRRAGRSSVITVRLYNRLKPVSDAKIHSTTGRKSAKPIRLTRNARVRRWWSVLTAELSEPATRTTIDRTELPPAAAAAQLR